MIERVGCEGLSEVLRIEHECFADPWSAVSFSEVQQNAAVFFACARDRTASPVLGYVVAWFILDQAEIANLAVSRAFRRRGVGAALLDAALSEADDRQVTAIHLEVRQSNSPARRLYESRGFVEVGRRRAYYRRPVEDAVVLRRRTDPSPSPVAI